MSFLTTDQKEEETWHDSDKKQHNESDVARKVATRRQPASWCAACAVRTIGLAHNGVQRAHNGVQRAQTASRSAHLPASVLSQAPCPTKCFLFVSLSVSLFVVIVLHIKCFLVTVNSTHVCQTVSHIVICLGPCLFAPSFASSFD